MSTLIIDINKKCGYSSRLGCRCTRAKNLLTAKAGKVGTTDFTYCTHEAKNDEKINKVTWQGIDLERTNGIIDPFEGSSSITAFYYQKRGSLSAIRKPLLIRAKRYKHTHWYENVGGYANKRWRKLRNDESDGYPRGDDNYYGDNGTEFLERLRGIACILHVAHGIKIDSTQDQTINCTICHENSKIAFKTGNNSHIPSYVKYEYNGSGISDRSILVYEKSPLTYRKYKKGLQSYYLPILLDDMISSVNVYYWDGDKGKINPLLLGLVGTNNISYWYENFGYNREEINRWNHEKWRPIGLQSTGKFKISGHTLKTRLDILNCIYNRTVQISIGKLEDCHPNHHILHKNRISYGYGEVFGTYPVLFAHTYESSANFPNGSFNVSEFLIDNKRQNSGESPLTFTDVKRLIAYVSPCDPNVPFLICAEPYSGNDYKWYLRKKNENYWDVYKLTSDQKPPDKANGAIKQAFEEVKNTLGIENCNAVTGDTGIRLKIDETVTGKASHLYHYEDALIIVTKEIKNAPIGFFKNSHKVNTTTGHFTVDKPLQGGGQISELKQFRQGVENVNVYFWDGASANPILLGIKQKDQDPKYYGKLAANKTWGPSQVAGLSEQQALDHQNCQHNSAIPIDLKDPTDFTRFLPHDKYTCLKNKTVTRSSDGPKLPSGASDTYTGQGYKIPSGTKISRVTYDNKPTDIVPLYEENPTLHLYYWNAMSNIPLLVEFKGRNGSEWRENLGKGPRYQEWRKIEKKIDEFYKDNNPQEELTENFIDKLDEVNCRIHEVVQINISRTNRDTYCHSFPGHKKRILVAPQSKNTYSGFTGYEHTPVDLPKTLTISSFYNGDIKQKITGVDLPLRNVKKVTVYFPECPGGAPVALHVEYKKSGGSTKEETWLKRKTDEWVDATKDFESKLGNTMELENFLEKIKEETKACIQPKGPLPKQQIDDDNDSGDSKDKIEEIFKNADTLKDEEKLGDAFLVDEFEEKEVKENEKKVILISDISTSASDLGASRALHVTVAQTEVIIDINQNVEEENERTYTPTGGHSIDLYRDEDPEDSNFYRYTHIKSENVAGDSFMVDKVKYGDTKNITVDLGINQGENIKHLAAWYWKGDQGMTNPLLVEVLDKYGNYKYHYNKDGASWSPYTPQATQFLGEPLENLLNKLNCQHNKVVQIQLENRDISRRYCHDIDSKINHSKYRISVFQHGAPEGFIAFSHTPNTAEYKSDFTFNVSSINIRKKKQDFDGIPFLGVYQLTVYFLSCAKSEDPATNIPLLVYLTDGKRNKWYARRKKGGNSWYDISRKLNKKHPSEAYRIGHLQNTLMGIKQKLQINCGMKQVSKSREALGEKNDIEGGWLYNDYFGPSQNSLNAIPPPQPRNTLGSRPNFRSDNEIIDPPIQSNRGHEPPGLPQKKPENSNFDHSSSSQAQKDGALFSVPSAPIHPPIASPTQGPTGPSGDKGDAGQASGASADTDELFKAIDNTVDLGSTLAAAVGSVAIPAAGLYGSVIAGALGTVGLEVTKTVLGGSALPPTKEASAVAPTETSTPVTPEPPTSESAPGDAQAFAEVAVATGLGIWSISGISSGTLAGSAATFFGGWKLYNHYKGDPWAQEPPPAPMKKSLPVPEEKKGNKRGGKRYRKMKERYAIGEYRKQANRLKFGEEAEDDYGLEMDDGMGMLGKSSGHGRMIIQPKQTKIHIPKKRQISMQSSGATNGMSSSLIFTPFQGIELCNPDAAKKVSKGTTSSILDNTRGFLKVAKKEV